MRSPHRWSIDLAPFEDAQPRPHFASFTLASLGAASGPASGVSFAWSTQRREPVTCSPLQLVPAKDRTTDVPSSVRVLDWTAVGVQTVCPPELKHANCSVSFDVAWRAAVSV